MTTTTMGNEISQLKGLVIEEKATEITDFWTQHQAKINDTCRYFSLKCDGSVSVFKGEAVLGPLWSISTPLEKFSNNLLKFRHPCIVRYLSSWQQKSTLHLATEYVQPLKHVLPTLNPLQICIGLNNILRALVFLHEQGGMSHNNVCVSAIYVTGDGQWKLGGLQYLCPFNNLTSVYLKQARIHRYDKAVDPNEDSCETVTNIDQFAFAALVEDTFTGHRDDEVPHLKDFQKYCRDYLQHSNPLQRPPLKDLLQHNFFNHQFISIYKFLNFLPLKSEEEKSQFFANILENLKCYDEETVAKQLGGHLLSRLSFLDQTARRDVIPYILKPKNERLQNGEQQGFFSLKIFKEHVKPRLMQLFGVRDLQIRMQLLTHFSKYVHIFSQEELSQHVLPELLLGIKDANDTLVASTLVCLSELVPILGAETVIGGKRAKLFTDGRPNSKLNSKSEESAHSFIRNVAQNYVLSEEQFTCTNDHSDYSSVIIPNERPSPVGGESADEEMVAKDFKETSHPESEDDWSDWENTSQQIKSSSKIFETPTMEVLPDISLTSAVPSSHLNMDPKKISVLQKAALEAKKNLVDISELDIKNQKAQTGRKSDEIDFFADMTPVIEKPSIINVVETMDNTSKLNFVSMDDGVEEAGWGENWDE